MSTYILKLDDALVGDEISVAENYMITTSVKYYRVVSVSKSKRTIDLIGSNQQEIKITWRTKLSCFKPKGVTQRNTRGYHVNVYKGHFVSNRGHGEWI